METFNITKSQAKIIAEEIEVGLKKTIKKLGLIDTGKLYKSIKVKPKQENDGYTFNVNSQEYLIYNNIIDTYFDSKDWYIVRDQITSFMKDNAVDTIRRGLRGVLNN